MSFIRKLNRVIYQLFDWRYLAFYWQRRFLLPEQRERFANRIASRQPSIDSGVKETQISRQASKNLIETGLARIGSVLEADQCKELYDYFTQRYVHDGYRPEIPPYMPLSEARHPHNHVAFHTAEDVVRAPYLLELANRPEILQVIQSFLGCRPTISYLAVWWSYPTNLGAQQAEIFHRDVDDWRFAKLFVYLTDVDADSGAHVYVERSARSIDLLRIRRYDDTEVNAAFDSRAVQTLTGQAGTAFIENTFGLHKGQPVQKGHRLIFQAVYSLNPVPYGPKRPLVRFEDVAVAHKLDRWVNRVYLSS